MKKGSYALTLTIAYETKVGEDLFVVGSIKELGEWKNLEKVPLTWTEGHIWVTKTPIYVNDQAHFNYKYLLKTEGGDFIWENGANRVADLHIVGHSGAPVFKFAKGTEELERYQI